MSNMLFALDFDFFIPKSLILEVTGITRTNCDVACNYCCPTPATAASPTSQPCQHRQATWQSWLSTGQQHLPGRYANIQNMAARMITAGNVSHPIKTRISTKVAPVYC
jgi:hypothetical protein